MRTRQGAFVHFKTRNKGRETNRNEWRVALKWGKGYVDRDRLSDDLSYVRHCATKPNPFLDCRRDMRRVFDLFDCAIDWLLQDGDEAGSQVMICRILREKQTERERERENSENWRDVQVSGLVPTNDDIATISRNIDALLRCLPAADWQLSWDRTWGSHYWKLLLLLRDSGDLTNPNIWHAKRTANSLSLGLINNASIRFPFPFVCVQFLWNSPSADATDIPVFMLSNPWSSSSAPLLLCFCFFMLWCVVVVVWRYIFSISGHK